MSIRFRRACAADASVIAHFNCCLARETEQKELCRATVESGVVRGLTKGDEVQYWVAETPADLTGNNDQIVGQLMLTREWSDWRDGWMIWLQSVYVMPDLRRRGVFRNLFQYVVDQLSEQTDVVAIRLYVEHDNQPAMATYGSLGFRATGYLVMELPTGRTPAI